MKTQGITLYPFVPSGPSFATSLAFFEQLGFVKQWEQAGIAGLRFGLDHAPVTHKASLGARLAGMWRAKIMGNIRKLLVKA